MSVIHGIQEKHSELTAIRRDLHAHPQTAFEETYASELIATRLEEWGVTVTRGLAGTGVVGTLEGEKTASGSLAAIGLRADIDALDIEEQNGFEHKSVNPGKMHACGHDGHTTMLLGAAQYLAKTKNFAGTVQFIFQPAEENEGGGRVMVEDGLFDKFPVDAVFGMHNWPGMPIGEFAVSSGPMMAAFDVFEITVKGKGTHAALPHLGVDPVVAASQMVTALQTIVSRNVSALQRAVLTITQIHAGDTWNVIPDTAILRGTVRTFRGEIQSQIETRMQEVAQGVAAALNCTAELNYDRRYPATVNTETETEWSAEAAVAVVGADKVFREPEPCMGSEDFSYMLQERPGCYIWMGNGPSDNGRLLHNPRYDFNDAAIPVGSSYWARLVEMLLPA
jgi:hippurate hydrolase